MVEHQSKEVVDKLSRDLKIQPALALPKELGERIQPVFNVNPERLIKVKSLNISDSASGTIFTTSSTKETFITGVDISISKDAVSTSTSSFIRATPFGSAATPLIVIRYEPTTAGQISESFPIVHPIKLQKSTAVELLNSTAVASIDATAVVYYYEVDPQ